MITSLALLFSILAATRFYEIIQASWEEVNLTELVLTIQLKHGRYVNWRERRAKEKAYFRQIRMVMVQAREAGLIED